ncbi:hypothetical protein E8E13_010866 [Curvularia kusanoi]|uniref:Uncharacterized protein n=1 Tax=Curvularia kusanoi TaxID=90978 RepID=A0A9P4TM02_CURKU|nr:hypothetical protein E8E13_010866 [Curvularia kusanoi]
MNPSIFSEPEYFEQQEHFVAQHNFNWTYDPTYAVNPAASANTTTTTLIHVITVNIRLRPADFSQYQYLLAMDTIIFINISVFKIILVKCICAWQPPHQSWVRR